MAAEWNSLMGFRNCHFILKRGAVFFLGCLSCLLARRSVISMFFVCLWRLVHGSVVSCFKTRSSICNIRKAHSFSYSWISFLSIPTLWSILSNKQFAVSTSINQTYCSSDLQIFSNTSLNDDSLIDQYVIIFDLCISMMVTNNLDKSTRSFMIVNE